MAAKKNSAHKTGSSRNGKAAGRQPASVKTITTLEAELEKLRQTEADRKDKYTKALETRRGELEESRTGLRQNYDEQDASLKSELDDILGKLGQDVQIDVSSLVGGEAEAEDDGDGDDGEAYDVIDAKFPRKLRGKMGKTSEGEERSEEEEDARWDQMMTWPFQTEDAVPPSLDGYIALIVANGDGEQVNTKTLEYAAKALGHTSKSANFGASISTANNRLKALGIIKATKDRGCFVTTAKGKKYVASMVKEADAMYAEGGEEEEEGSSSSAKVDPSDIRQCLLVGIAQAGGSVGTNDLGKVTAAAGFKTPDVSADKIAEMMQVAVSSLKKQEKITFDRSGNKVSLDITEAGEAEVEKLVAA